ncbi:uncharacterized protein LOC144631468 [Oculina patagonica]
MAEKRKREKGEASSSDEDEGTPTGKSPLTGAPELDMRKRTEAEEEGEDEQTEVVVANEADDLDNNQEDDPLPGFTTSGQRIQQCSDPGGRHSPVGGVACPPRDAAIPQEHADLDDAVVFIFVIMYLIFRM